MNILASLVVGLAALGSFDSYAASNYHIQLNLEKDGSPVHSKYLQTSGNFLGHYNIGNSYGYLKMSCPGNSRKTSVESLYVGFKVSYIIKNDQELELLLTSFHVDSVDEKVSAVAKGRCEELGPRSRTVVDKVNVPLPIKGSKKEMFVNNDVLVEINVKVQP